MIRVRVANPDSGRVVLWERHPDHPDGEVFLVGSGEFVVAATAAVEARLRNGSLVAALPAIAAASPTPAQEAEATPAPKRPSVKRGRGDS